MGQEESAEALPSVACGKTMEEAYQNLELLLRCYVDDDFRVITIKYNDSAGLMWQKKVAERKGKILDIRCKQNSINKLFSAEIDL